MSHEPDEKAAGTPRPDPFTTPRMAELELEIGATRAELAESIDALVARLTPGAVLHDAQAAARGLVTDASGSGDDPAAARRARIVLGGVAAGVALVVGLVVLRARRR
ncbi:DUF3618 domain-containing protein [Cellulomonas sp. HZM]|uniref:DUF3618 domain-containing protein n=1 Tax=Cellulomonas sp. HZM TaxID=1454010 RepID=UPI00068E0BCE|nr:DUF3618 domain-containing protein [Cellulomonas sp. HZM]